MRVYLNYPLLLGELIRMRLLLLLNLPLEESSEESLPLLQRGRRGLQLPDPRRGPEDGGRELPHGDAAAVHPLCRSSADLDCCDPSSL